MLRCGDHRDPVYRWLRTRGTAVAAGRSILAPSDAVIVVTVVEEVDPMLVADGGGHAGSTLSPEDLEMLQTKTRTDGEAIVHTAAGALGIGGVETRVLEGRPGPVLCSFATEVGATAIVIGARGAAASSARSSGRCATTSCATRRVRWSWSERSLPAPPAERRKRVAAGVDDPRTPRRPVMRPIESVQRRRSTRRSRGSSRGLMSSAPDASTMPSRTARFIPQTRSRCCAERVWNGQCASTPRPNVPTSG